MAEETVFVSGHLLRRTARSAERKLEAEDPGNQYRIKKTGRGPFRYEVRRVIGGDFKVKPIQSERPPGRRS